MPSILSKLKSNYPNLKFQPKDNFIWEPASRTIYYDPSSDYLSSLLLHEVSHAIMGHSTYRSDIDLIKMESEAWQKASEISGQYDHSIPQDLIEESLDSYRDWLHDRSTCPTCSSTGIQIKSRTYRCLACAQEWNVNEARNCQLRRYKTK